MDSPVDRGAAMVSVKTKDLEEPLPVPDGTAAVGNGGGGGRGAASISIEIEDPEAAARFEFRATASNATPPSTNRRLSSRSRKQGGPTKFVAAGAAEFAGPENPYSGASSLAPVIGPHESVSAAGTDDQGYAPVTGPLPEFSAVADDDQGAAPGDDRKKKRACFPPGSKVAIARATPPDSYRILPSRTRKQFSPRRFIAEGAPASAGAQALNDASASSKQEAAPPRALRGTSVQCVTADERGGCESPSASTTLGAPPREPHDGRRRVYGVLGVLGASLALSVVSCVLFYIVGERSQPGPSGEQLKK